MYVTRPLSMYKRDPSALLLPPPEGPNSGILVIQDEEAQPTCCFGLCKSNRVRGLPFPQNKNLKVCYVTGAGENQHVYINRVVFIPVLNQPLSSNQYYVIERKGKRKGKAYKNSTEEDKVTCCFCRCVSDLEPEPLDHREIYQQFEIKSRDWGGFVAKSVAPGGFPPTFLRRKGWNVLTSKPRDFELNEASGLNNNLRARLPDFNFPSLQKSSTSIVVGKWYSPFMFVKEGTPKDQMSLSRYYMVTLEQRWEQIFACENYYNSGNSVTVDVVVETEVVEVAGREVASNERNIADGFMWFRSGGREVGLSLSIVERLKWEQERAGWDGGSGRKGQVKRVEEFGGMGEWRKFGCYMLVESFALKRMDGSILLTYGFNHTHQIKSKWE